MSQPLPAGLVTPHPDRLAPDHRRYDDILATHARAIAAGEDGYVDPASGYWVFTADYLWQRGFCCEQGCRHCPWIDRPGHPRPPEPGADVSQQPRRADGTSQGRVFGEVARAYDQVRPGYPDGVFDLLAERVGPGDDVRVVEIGAGTGKATASLVARGWDVTAVEPDAAMAEILAERIPAATVVASSFEDVEPGSGYDLVCAAQSWHWVDAERGFARAAALLRAGGTLAMWWNLPTGTDPELGDALDAVYRHLAPAMTHGHWHRDRFGFEDDGVVPTWPEPFGPVDEVDVAWSTTYSADEWVVLLSTQSDHRMLTDDVRERLLTGVHEVVESRGGVVPLAYVCRVHLASTPPPPA